MAYNSFRQKDMEAERELALFLDEHLYTRPEFSKAERTNAAYEQIKGSDIILSIPSLDIIDAVVDEKASIYYINKDLNTFVLELSFLNKDYHYNEGWFINDNLLTEYYLMQWIKANVSDPWKVKKENITEVECVLVSKSKLRTYFDNEGYNKQALLELANKMRKEKQKTFAIEGKPYRFYYTEKLAEKPINILLEKKAYIELGELHFIIKK